MSQITPLILLVVLILAFYLIVLRPARTQQRNQAELQRSIEVGDKVVISAGVFGTVAGLEESRVRLEIAPGTVIEVARQVVVRRAEEPSGDESDLAAQTSTTEATPDEAVPAETSTDPAGSVSSEEPTTQEPATKTATKKAPAKKTAAKKTAAKKAAAKKAPARRSASAKTAADAVPAPDATDSTLREPQAEPDAASGDDPGLR